MEPRDPAAPGNAGREYLRAQTLAERRAGGRVYSPPHIVDFVLEQAGYVVEEDLENQPVLDPACGAGVFLEHAVTNLYRRLVVHGQPGFESLTTAVEANIWGIDLDARACAIARKAVRDRISILTGRQPSKSFFSANVLTADFLMDVQAERIPPILEARLGYIVGNPPYVSTTRLSGEYKNRLRRKFESATGRIDLYAMFIERGLKLLPRGGRLALITPDKFISSYSGRRLRSLILASSAVRAIARFSSHTVFEGAAIVPCVTVLERGGMPSQVRVLSCGYRSDRARVETMENRHIEQAALGKSAWRLLPDDTARLVAKLRTHHPTLKDLTIRISAGPATGRDNLFLLPRHAGHDIEPELLRPAVRGRDIIAHRISDPGLDLLVPYTFDGFRSVKPIRLADYPKAAKYLRKHREELTTRHCVRVWKKDWYEFHDHPVLDLAKQRKILVPDVANSNRFAIDTGKYFPLHSAYYMLAQQNVDLDYVVALLNSSVASFLIRTEAPVVKDGFNRYRRQFLMTLPVPSAPSHTRKQVIAAACAGNQERVNELVQRLFGLNDDEYAAIEARLSYRLAA